MSEGPRRDRARDGSVRPGDGSVQPGDGSVRLGDHLRTAGSRRGEKP
ncbi:hypothetical protein [Streptomyces sp. NPDC014894]